MLFKVGSVIEDAFDSVKGKKLAYFICTLCAILLGLLAFVGAAFIVPQAYAGSTYEILTTLFVFMILVSPIFAAIGMIGLRAARHEPVSKGIAFQYMHKAMPSLGLLISLSVVYAFIFFI